MKRLNTLLLLALIGLNAYMYWKITRIESRLGAVERTLNATASAARSGPLDDANTLLAAARQAVKAADFGRAQKLIDQSVASASSVRRTASVTTDRAASWIRSQAAALQAQIRKETANR